ncbi:MAG: acetolactate synthase small subunit [Rikenellaceae bacterium]
MENILYTITVYSENHVGLLSQIATIFTRRRLNIESLSVSASALAGVHKFTITTYSDSETIVNVVKQIEKRIDVIRAFHYKDEEVVSQEIALYKVSTDLLLSQGGLEQLVRQYGVRILEVNENFTVIEKTGQREETQQLFEELSKYKVLQFVRSGRVSITKSTREPVSHFLAKQESRRNEQ